MPIREDYKPQNEYEEDYIIETFHGNQYIRVLTSEGSDRLAWIGTGTNFDGNLKKGTIVTMGAFLNASDLDDLIDVLSYMRVCMSEDSERNATT